jgi:hypothetical protein
MRRKWEWHSDVFILCALFPYNLGYIIIIIIIISSSSSILDCILNCFSKCVIYVAQNGHCGS